MAVSVHLYDSAAFDCNPGKTKYVDQKGC